MCVLWLVESSGWFDHDMLWFVRALNIQSFCHSWGRDGASATVEGRCRCVLSHLERVCRCGGVKSAIVCAPAMTPNEFLRTNSNPLSDARNIPPSPFGHVTNGCWVYLFGTSPQHTHATYLMSFISAIKSEHEIIFHILFVIEQNMEDNDQFWGE